MGQVKINVAPRSNGISGGELEFPGATVTHKFTPEELSMWTGYDGTGSPDGIWDSAGQRMTV